MQDVYLPSIQVKMLYYYHHNKVSELETVTQFWNFFLRKSLKIKTSYVFALPLFKCMI